MVILAFFSYKKALKTTALFDSGAVLKFNKHKKHAEFFSVLS
jgi:hypothetical protein